MEGPWRSLHKYCLHSWKQAGVQPEAATFLGRLASEPQISRRLTPYLVRAARVPPHDLTLLSAQPVLSKLPLQLLNFLFGLSSDFKAGSPVAQADFEFLVLCLLGGGDDRFRSALSVSALLGIEPRILLMPGKHSTY